MLKYILPLLLLVLPAAHATHLILYFDLNKTLIAEDSNGGKTQEEIVLSAIADRVLGCWDETMNAPITYDDYISHHYSKKERKNHLSQVLQVLKETDHPEYATMQEIYTQAILKLQNHHIFPSVYRLIEHLDEKSISYTLVIRTYGAEGPEIIQELNKHLTHKKFSPDPLTPFLDQTVLTSPHHLLIQDDFDLWKTHNWHWQAGKPFPIHNNNDIITLFFDDNAKIDPENPDSNIVFPYDAATNTPIHPQDAINQGNLIPVDMLDALLDDTYYINHVQASTGTPYSIPD